jgi:subtilisin family serine protease
MELSLRAHLAGKGDEVMRKSAIQAMSSGVTGGVPSAGGSVRFGRALKATALGSVFASIFVLQGCTPTRGPERPVADVLVPVLNERAPKAIPGRYIIIFKEEGGTAAATRKVRNAAAAAQSMAAQRLVQQLGGRVDHVYTSAVTGFSAALSPAALERLRAMPGVALIEADQEGTIATVQNNPPTGLDRVSERLLPLDNRFTFGQTGTGIHAYVIDTGIRATHNDFGGRVTGGTSVVSDPNALTDCQGHGTHVAGTIGGTIHGVAKLVNLHPVRAFLCTGSAPASNIIAGVDWVTANGVQPAVVNMSVQYPVDPIMDTAVSNSVAAGFTYVIAAGNWNADACNTSPGRTPVAITVGSVDPANDTRASDSNFGTCLDLFSTGVNILSAGIASDSATATMSGTSMASPHAAGVAALYLQNHMTDTPVQVWNAMNAAANLNGTTLGWAGIVDPRPGSPNKLLHWGSVGVDGMTDGDPHLTTVDGVHYDFQSAGEFVLLREQGGMEVQVRQTPVATTARPGAAAYHGLATCVSLNTAVATRAGGRRVSFQPNISGVPDPAGLQLRIDGALTPLTPAGVNLGPDVVRSSGGGGMEVVYADGTRLVATPNWWASQGLWYMNISVLGTRADRGLIGTISPGSWLPGLPNGSSMGPMPAAMHQRYLDLYGKFADAWRVTNGNTLFDYRPGTSTASFTIRAWPTESGPCKVPVVPRMPGNPAPPARPVDAAIAEQACRPIRDRFMRADCVFDVTYTGEVGFAKSYLVTERYRAERPKPGEERDRPNR